MDKSDINVLIQGEGQAIVLLHGLFGALSNFEKVIEHFKQNYTIIFPFLPLYTAPIKNATVQGMVVFIENLVNKYNLNQFHIVGNSLGGHIGLVYAINNLSKVASITLTGSSGLFENSLGGSYPNRKDYNFVKKKTEETFYNTKNASKELVDEVFETVNNREKALRTISLARSAVRHNLRSELNKITCPVNLIWGQNDTITPLFVAEEFKKLLPHAQLNIIDQCGHAPMMEQAEQFNNYLEQFLNTLNKKEQKC